MSILSWLQLSVTPGRWSRLYFQQHYFSWQSKMVNYMLALKSFCPEVTHITSVHISLAKASHVVIPKFYRIGCIILHHRERETINMDEYRKIYHNYLIAELRYVIGFFPSNAVCNFWGKNPSINIDVCCED